MNRIKTAIVTFALVTCFAGNAAAAIKVWVLNCTGEGEAYEAKSYNAKDGSQYIAYNEKWVDDGEVKKLKCLGQGKGRCKIEIDTFWTVNVDKNHTLVLDNVDGGHLSASIVDGQKTTCD